MADLAASNVTVVVERNVRSSELRQKRNRVKVTFGDGVLTYPVGGVPLPAISAFGFTQFMEYLNVVEGDSTNGISWKYDKTNNKLRGYWPSGGAATPPTAAETDPAASVPTMSGADSVTITTHTHTATPGEGKEFVGGTTTIAAQTIYGESVGW